MSKKEVEEEEEKKGGKGKKTGVDMDNKVKECEEKEWKMSKTRKMWTKKQGKRIMEK